MNAPIRDALDWSSQKPMRRHFVSGFPRAFLSLSQEKSSGVEIVRSKGKKMRDHSNFIDNVFLSELQEIEYSNLCDDDVNKSFTTFTKK